ncbi:MAG TPA: DUF5522 domain-containing protein [Holophagaceae bacterium]|nr:DUF5522 domain-containing protein [Holophagaceae bacterium]
MGGAHEPDFYLERGFRVTTAACHLRRGECCGCGCRHCPFDPGGVRGTTRVRPEFRQLAHDLRGAGHPEP